MDRPDRESGRQSVSVWDLGIRLFHWLLVVSVVFLLVSGETGWLFFDWHRPIGEFVFLLILFRLIWGVAGSENARLHTLVVNPREVLRHLLALLRGQPGLHRGHNAAGGWVVLIMIALLGFQAVSGWYIADEDEFVEGAFYGLLSEDATGRLYYLHHLNAEVLQFLIFAHVVAILLYRVRGGQNLVLPMITGQMSWQSGVPLPALMLRSAWFALGVLALAAFFSAWLLSWWN